MKVPVDLLITHAKIYTIDERFSVVEALAIKDGEVHWTGSVDEALANFSGKELNLKGKFIYPGFIDAHCHFMSLGKTYFRVNLVGTNSFEEVIEKVKSFAEKNDVEWIQGRGWDQNDWEVKEFPQKNELDVLFPDRPVLLKRIDGHAALANQKAIELAGINSNSKVEGGIFETKNGKLTGILIDNAIESVENRIPRAPGLDQKSLLKAQDECFKFGLTTVSDAFMEFYEFEMIKRMQIAGKLKMRIYGMLAPTKENKKFFFKNGPIKSDKLTIRSFKYFADGALGSRGAALLEPYSDDRENSGLFLKPPDSLRNAANECFQHGFQMNTHCIGDSANRMMLQLYGEILKEKNDKRWRIEHAQVVHENDFQLFGKYSVIPSVQSTHATSDMYWAEERLGASRLKNAYAYKKLLDENGFIANGSDFPIEHHNPLLGFYASVARKDLKDFPESGFQIENALSKEEALKAMTIWAAYSNFEEKEKGSLEVGKFADFVVLEEDIMKIAAREIPQTKVLMTFLNGEVVYQRK